MIKKNIKNNNGSGIIWAMAAVMILLVIVAGTLSFAYYTYRASIDNGSLLQAQLTAENAVESVGKMLEEEPESGQFIPSNIGEQLKIAIELPEGMGTITNAYIEKVEADELLIFVRATVGNLSSECRGKVALLNGKWITYYLDNIDSSGGGS